MTMSDFEQLIRKAMNIPPGITVPKELQEDLYECIRTDPEASRKLAEIRDIVLLELDSRNESNREQVSRLDAFVDNLLGTGENDHQTNETCDTHLLEPVAALGEKAAVPLTQEARNTVRQWRFVRSASDCNWKDGDSKQVGHEKATIDLVWDSKTLNIFVGGFLRLGVGYCLVAQWESEDGTIHAAGELTGIVGAVILKPSTGAAPRDSDCIIIRHNAQTTAAQWEVRVSLILSDGVLVEPTQSRHVTDE